MDRTPLELLVDGTFRGWTGSKVRIGVQFQKEDENRRHEKF